MDTFTYIPSASTRGTAKPRKLKAQFGDGYMQESSDGINAQLRQWELVFTDIHVTEGTGASGANLKDINDFLTTQGAYKKFLWTQPSPFNIEGAMMWVCEEWEWLYDRGSVVGLRAVFEQRPS